MKIFSIYALVLGAFLTGCASPKSAQKVEEARNRLEIAEAMFRERCKNAGEKIHKTVENVEGVFLMKLRPGDINYGDQFKLDDPYGRDLGGDGYIQSFVRGSYQADNRDISDGGPPRLGYAYVEAIDPKTGKRYRYTGSIKAVGKMDATAPNVKVELKRNPNFDLNIYAFVLERTPATGSMPRYGVTYDDISTREEREYWIAGSSLKIIDMKTNEVIAERVGYMMDRAQGSQAGQRSPWLLATGNACPSFLRNYKILRASSSAPRQTYQTLDFVEKVLKPSR
jgi:hypothetical protein